MSLITQCPACATMFRIVPDQLRISEGWVRCGQCEEVFDANAHLRNLDGTYVEPVPVPSPPQASEEILVPEPPPAQPEPAYDWGPVIAAPQAAEVAAPAFVDLLLPPHEVPAAEPVQSPDDWHREPVEEPHPQDVPTYVVLDEEVEDTIFHPFDAEPSSQEPAEPGHGDAIPSELAPLSFMSTGPSEEGSRSWLGRWVLIAASVVFAVVLSVQILLQERDAIAAKAPGLRSMLVSGCDVVGCKVSPLRDIESIAIDSSAFTSLRPGVYLLKVTLKNAAAIELAMPALELTLTDAQDGPLLRRVLLPAEVSRKMALAAGAEYSTSLPIGLKSDAVPEKISGYKLLAFYP